MRREAAIKREIQPDSVYNDIIVSKFINCLMIQGKKHLSENIFYGAVKLVEEKMKESGIEVFHRAISNVKPVLEVKSRRIGGATYQVPMEVRPTRTLSLAIKWIIKYARDRKDKSMIERLAREFMDAAKAEGGAAKKREEVHKVAEANRAFAHYKW